MTVGVGSLLPPCGLQGWNSGHQTWQQTSYLLSRLAGPASFILISGCRIHVDLGIKPAFEATGSGICLLMYVWDSQEVVTGVQCHGVPVAWLQGLPSANGATQGSGQVPFAT